MKSLFWSVAFVFSLVFLAGAYYITSENVRTSVDARAPWVHRYLGQFVRDSADSKRTISKQSTAEAPDTAPRFVETNATPVPATPVPAPPPEPEAFDLNKLAKNPAAWPAKIMIHKATDFPAVVNGRVAGMIHAPAGTEVKLAKISDGRLGVEYQGGGAWLLVEETDLVARTMNKRN